MTLPQFCSPVLWTAAFAIAGSVSAQVPEGSYVVAARGDFTFGAGSGLWVVDSRAGTAAKEILGLPDELTNHLFSFGYYGTASVELDQRDGTLFVGEYSSTAQNGYDQIDLHVIDLDSLFVASDTKINVGRANVNAAITAIELLATGDLLIGVADLVAEPPLNGSPLGIVDPKTGSVTPIPIAAVPSGTLEAAVVDPRGVTAYFAMFPLTGGSGGIYRVPLSGGPPEFLLSTLPIFGLTNSQVGTIYAATVNAVAEFNPTTLQFAPVVSIQENVTGVALEDVTGQLLFVVREGGPWGTGVFRSTPNGVFARLTTIPSGGSPDDIAVKHNPWTYGADTPGTNTYRWQTAPNPGGLPRIGNDQFGLQLNATPSGNASGALLVSLGTASISVAGIELLLDPTTMLQAGALPPNGYVPLPLPDDVTLIGAKLFFQSVHLDGGVLASSNGLRMTVMQ